MPFTSNVVAKHGEIFGNHTVRSDAGVTNAFKFSYPGYNEMISGHPDLRIDSNNSNNSNTRDQIPISLV